MSSLSLGVRWLKINVYNIRKLTWIVCGVFCLTFLYLTVSLGYSKPRDPYLVNEIASEPPPKTYTILFWNYGEGMIRRFVRSYGHVAQDPFKHCSVNNCVFRIDRLAALNESDAIVLHLHQIKGPEDVPPYRFPHQRWVFFTDESPMNTFMVAKMKSLKDYNDIFNWSMTYSWESDVPVPYGRTAKLPYDSTRPTSSLPNYFQINNKATAVVGSNCGGSNQRWPFIRELQRHTPVDIYGRCGNLSCPGGYMGGVCPLIRGYKFYLAFENCNCREYISEKMWYNAFTNEAVPVVMGARVQEYQRACPPHSFIHVDDFDGPESLAKYLNYLSQNETAYNSYFAWKSNYRISNEHGYFHTESKHICRLCEALNDHHKPPKVYDDLEAFWGKESACRGPKWKPKYV